MKKIYYLICVLTALILSHSTVSFAQSTDNSQVRISGTITDSLDQKPIAFATVAISIRIGEIEEQYGQVADNEGYFRIALPYATNYKIECSYVGKKFNPINISPKEGEKEIKLGKLFMTDDESTQLNELQVVSARPLVKMEIDRLSYAMKEDREAPTKSLLDMLRKVPLVTVDGQGNIQVKGSSNFRIFFNGKPSPMFDQDPKNILRSIPAATIRKVEVITEPGVKYEAEGINAIINIVTDEATGDGLMGSVSAYTGYPAFGAATVYLAMKKGKWGLSSNFTLNKGTAESRNNLSQINKRNDTRNEIRYRTDDIVFSSVYGNALLSFELDSLNLLTANLALRPNKTTFTTNGENRFLHKENLLKEYKFQNRDESSGGNIQAGLDYQHSTLIPNELLTLSYRASYSPRSSFSRNTFYKQSASGLDSIKKGNTDAGLWEHTAQIDYVRPFLSRHMVEVGAKFIHRYAFSNPTHKYFDQAAGEWRPLMPKPGEEMNFTDFLHYYNIWAGYAAYTYKRDRWSAKAGARLEGGQLHIEYKDLPQANYKDNFFDWIPEVNFDYKPSDSQQIKLAYNFHIKRPHITQLNPYVKETAYVHEQGNPNLDPARNHTGTLSYSYTHPVITAMLSASYLYTENIIEERYAPHPHLPGVLLKSYGNFGRSYGPSFSSHLFFMPFTFIRFSLDASATYTTWDAKQLDLKASDWSYNGSLYTQIMMPKDWSASYYFGLYNAGRSLQSVSKTMFYDAISITKTFLLGRLNVSLGISNPWTKESLFESITDTKDMKLISENYNVNRYIHFNISYRFGSLSSQVKKTTRSIVNDDLGIGKDNQNKGGIQAGM